MAFMQFEAIWEVLLSKTHLQHTVSFSILYQVPQVLYKLQFWVPSVFEKIWVWWDLFGKKKKKRNSIFDLRIKNGNFLFHLGW